MHSLWHDSNKIILTALSLFLVLSLGIIIFLPLVEILQQSFYDRVGSFVFLDNFVHYMQEPKSLRLLQNSLFIACVSTLIVLPVAFIFAYALMRSSMPLKPLFRYLALIPLLAPSLLPAISFVYLFGNQGFLKSWMGDSSIYGVWGIVMGECFYVFPHVLMILLSALSLCDARLYEAAQSMGANSMKKFMSITLPSAKYGLISAALVSFTLVITDFGVPKVIGGDYAVLATEIYKQVIGQQNFSLGATIGVLLLIPSVITFGVDALMQKKQTSILSAKFVVYKPKKALFFDTTMFLFSLGVIGLLVIILSVSVCASFIKFWPYDLSFVLKHYDFNAMDGGGWDSYFNSLRLAFWSALFGTMLVFMSAYVVEKSKVYALVRILLKFLALLPMAVPGLVLGLGYIFFFNNSLNPLHGIYQSMTILVVCTIAHFFTTSYITAVTTLKQIDTEFDDVSESMGVAFYRTFFRVTVPIAIPSILEIARYFFVNAMTTVSAVVFLYSPQTTLASVAVLNMDDAGDISSATAMASLIVATSIGVTLCFNGISYFCVKSSQKWRRG
ncbi:putative 2-aminoethylphosphonate ABC transporter permease subunit [Sulfurospirillum barnesii]|uniref:Putative 2-aminoethylphosphonate ABC transporter, permease protein n=1 Tax=Sulfurospirillum barnesii (strain ATCC 700032 / DSM 10660 / SES-3) TaxID=760154 RepID=I3XZ79_SULBS|nr:putative 2-aminoethylphosphonate ABC transporter permease subunit [Sulfurospirillum barnesii]AFL69253.1 putative 2-aminoethylphosphonate ABC transporter, permease protein [Sulfurospirillum barnesii SES-3]